MEVFDVPAVVRRNDGLELCTPYGVVRFFDGGWEIERGGVGKDCDGDVVTLRTREEEHGVIIKYIDDKIYAVALWENYFPEAVVATSEVELPSWARF